MRNYTRFIPGEEIDAVEQWQFGAIDTAAQLLAAQVKAREAQEELAQDESERQQAFKEGFAQGLEQGKLQAQAQVQRQMQDFLANQGTEAANKLSQLFDSAQQQLTDAEQAMAQGVLALSCELARQVLRRELVVDTAAVMPALTEALGLLAAEHKAAVVKLNAVDMEALGEKIHADFVDMNLTLRADAGVLPGGCLVEAAGTVVDATVPMRWQRAVATLGLASSWECGDEPG
jgi:flagellar assembly protein FliH